MNQKRRSQIIKMLDEHSVVTNAELMEEFGISIETVRRDLAYLEDKGVLERVYGGAVRKEMVREELIYSSREQKDTEEKQKIAEATEKLLQNNDIVFFDIGTTVHHVAKKLDLGKKINAFTNAIRTAVTLSEKGNEVFLTGGRIRGGELALSGTIAESNLSNFNIDKAIISAAGITEDGISDFIVDEASLRSKAVSNASKVIVLADYTKFGVRAVCKVCAIEDVDVLITDSKAPKNILKKLEKKGVQIIIA